jgi:hypothetical protein
MSSPSSSSAAVRAALHLSVPAPDPVYTSAIPFDDVRIGAAAIYCSDGRFGEQMDEFLQHGLQLPRYDRLAIPGGPACLAGHSATYYEKSALARQLRFLIDIHGLNKLVLIAHDSCAFYNDVFLGSRPREHVQHVDIEKAAETIRSWNFKGEIESYFARKAGGRIAFERW